MQNVMFTLGIALVMLGGFRIDRVHPKTKYSKRLSAHSIFWIGTFLLIGSLMLV